MLVQMLTTMTKCINEMHTALYSTSECQVCVRVCVCVSSMLYCPPGLCVEEEPPSYDMDTEDEEWLNAQSRDRVSNIFLVS